MYFIFPFLENKKKQGPSGKKFSFSDDSASFIEKFYFGVPNWNTQKNFSKFRVFPDIQKADKVYKSTLKK